MAVFVLAKNKRPLMPCSEKRARLLLERGRAVVHRRYPFTIRLKDRASGVAQPLRLGIDPGSRATGLALMREQGDTRHILNLFELTHRGMAIRAALVQRRAFRRRRRTSHLRYRAPRFLNRTRPTGWLAPSLQHRVDTVQSWVARLRRVAPITAISQELVRFDTQQMANPEISGVQYQQGTLLGYEVREYLLEKWGRQCAYCGATNTPLEIDHIVPHSTGGSSRVSNLAISCRPCNQDKANQTLEAFFATNAGLTKRLGAHRLTANARLARVQHQRTAPLHDAAAINATRWALFKALETTGLPVQVASGGRTKYNRQRLGLPKTHALDAACVGTAEQVVGWKRPTWQIKATGRGSYQRTRLNRFGFPRGYLMRHTYSHGFQTGDQIIATVPTGKSAGIHQGRVAVRKTGSFNVQTRTGVVQGINHRYCRIAQRADGYGYTLIPTDSTHPKEVARAGSRQA